MTRKWAGQINIASWRQKPRTTTDLALTLAHRLNLSYSLVFVCFVVELTKADYTSRQIQLTQIGRHTCTHTVRVTPSFVSIQLKILLVFHSWQKCDMSEIGRQCHVAWHLINTCNGAYTQSLILGSVRLLLGFQKSLLIYVWGTIESASLFEKWR